MSLLKKRSFAIVIFVLVVVLFGAFGARRSLNKACRKAEAAFFDKSLLQAADYHTCPGEQLDYCADYANRLLSVIGNSGEWEGTYKALRTARAGLVDALDARDISAIGKANKTLVEAVEAVETMVREGAALPDSHDDYETILSEFHSAQALLDNGAYSSHILAFRDEVLGRFPANILQRLTGVKAPETFP